DNKDFVLRYNVSGAATQAGFMTQQDSHGNFFNLTIEPPAVPQSTEITPREMVFVLDTSGSMSGLPLDASKTFMHQALKTLRKTDYFRIVRFSNQASEFSKGPVLANPENLRQGNDFIDHLTADGGTETESGIHQALDAPPPENTMRIVVFLTDGYIGNEYDVLKLLGQKIGSARLYAFGVGDAVNRFLLDEMGRMGHGSARYVMLDESPEAAALDLANKLATPVLTDISVDWNTFKTQSVFPQKLPDLFAGDAIHLQGKYLNEGNHTVFIHGKIQGRKVTLPVQISVAPPLANANHLSSTPLSLMWARTQIGELMREWTSPGYIQGSDVDQASLQSKVTKLGLEYALMTQWTSFVAVSQKKVNPHPENTSEQSVPLPMVSGVSDKAYASTITSPDFSGSSVPEPENNLMLILLLLVLIGAGLYTKQKDKNRLRLLALANKSNHSI
ncbi:MAG: VWA domain-containing protein, partial [Cyanobacteria bacterium]|nr:VWA domain-containing protein [Cyanobacteriota bacterium]